MGFIFKRKDTGKYYVCFKDPSGRRIRLCIGTNKHLAEAILKKKETEIIENRYLDIRKENKYLFEQIANEFYEKYSKVNKRLSSSRRDSICLKHLIPFFKGKYLHEITPKMIEEYKAKRQADGVSVATINRELACMKNIYNRAIEWDKATENPVKKVKLFKENNQRVRFLEKGEIKILLDACPEFLKPIVIVALNTGMRLNEILTLTWDDIDFIHNLIRVRNSKNYEPRYIPINSVVRRTLNNLYQNCNPDSPYVFAMQNKKPFSWSYISHTFHRIVKKTGIKDFRFHDLRHCFASHLVMAGVDILTVKELLGHKSLEMTLRYSHLSQSHKMVAVEFLSSKLCELVPPEPREQIKEVEEILPY